MLGTPWRPRLPTTTRSTPDDASVRAVTGLSGSTITVSAIPRTRSRSGCGPRSPIATMGRTSAPKRWPSSAATANARADSGEPSTPATIRCGNSPWSGERLATRTEHGASCNNLVVTLPKSIPAGRAVPFDPTATRVASVRSTRLRRVSAGKPPTCWLVVGDRATDRARASASSASAWSCSTSCPETAPACVAAGTSMQATRWAGPLARRVACRTASTLSSDPSTPHTIRANTRPGFSVVVDTSADHHPRLRTSGCHGRAHQPLKARPTFRLHATPSMSRLCHNAGRTASGFARHWAAESPHTAHPVGGGSPSRTGEGRV